MPSFARLLRMPLVLLAAAAALALAACGTDDSSPDAAQSPAGSGASRAAAVDGDVLTYSPPFQPGDAVEISLSTSMTAEGGDDSMFGGFSGLAPFPAEPVNLTTGLKIIEAGPSGYVVEQTTPLTQFKDALAPQAAALDEGQAEAFAAVIDQLAAEEFVVRARVSPAGSVTEILNVDDLNGWLVGLVETIAAQAGAFSEDSEELDPSEIEEMKAGLAALLDSEGGMRIFAASAETAMAGLFMVPKGQYALGQPATVSTDVKALTMIPVPGKVTTTLTALNSQTAEFTITSTPDQGKMAEAMLGWLKALMTSMPGVTDADIEEMESSLDDPEFAMAASIFEAMAVPVTTTVSIDLATGWVTSTKSSLELSLFGASMAMEFAATFARP
jgi:hypothetical protein